MTRVWCRKNLGGGGEGEKTYKDLGVKESKSGERRNKSGARGDVGGGYNISCQLVTEKKKRGKVKKIRS